VRGFELLVGEPGALRTEHHRRRPAPRLGHDARRCVAHVQGPEVLVPIARGGGGDEAAARQRLRQGWHDARGREHVICTGGARGRFRIRKLLRIHEHELIQRHVLHGARRGADVARVRGRDQHDANAGGLHLLRYAAFADWSAKA
jgi:hypothetical protein